MSHHPDVKINFQKVWVCEKIQTQKTYSFLYFCLKCFCYLHTVCSVEALHSTMSFPVWQICLFVCSYVFEWQCVWLVSCCWKLRPVKGRKNGRVFESAAMAAVHFSPELLSEKPVTLLMINASVRRAVSELQQPLNPDSRCSLSPTTSGLQPQPVLQRNKSTAVLPHSGQRLFRPQLPTQKAYLVIWAVMLMCTDRWDLHDSVMSQGSSPRQYVLPGSRHLWLRDRVMGCDGGGIGMTVIAICVWTTRHLDTM